jgi:dienelactone hydrolase
MGLQRQLVCLMWLMFGLFTAPAFAGETVRVPTRPGIETNVFWHEVPSAKLTVLMFPGGAGGYGPVRDGWPWSANFLVRTAPQWADGEKFNYAVFGRPSDTPDLEYAERMSERHLADMRAVLEWLKGKTATPIWVVGTSRGTVSVSHLLVNTSDARIAGGVLSASITAPGRTGTLTSMALKQIKVPMLLIHHSADACRACPPAGVPDVLRALENAPVKRMMMVSGGGGATGDPCQALHYHGFVGMEADVVKLVSDWVRQPSGS